MTSTRDCYHRHSKVFSTDNMKLTSSASEQNVYFTYVCLVDDLRPTEMDDCDQYKKQYNLLDTRSDEVSKTLSFKNLNIFLFILMYHW